MASPAGSLTVNRLDKARVWFCRAVTAAVVTTGFCGPIKLVVVPSDHLRFSTSVSMSIPSGDPARMSHIWKELGASFVTL